MSERIAGISKTCAVKELKKVTKAGMILNNGYLMIPHGKGFVPRDPNFPVGQPQFFAINDTVAVTDLKDISNAEDVRKIKPSADSNIGTVKDTIAVIGDVKEVKG